MQRVPLPQLHAEIMLTPMLLPTFEPKYLQPIEELRAHLAFMAAPESDRELAWAVITSGTMISALFGKPR
jgi:hypothetical protein